VLVTASSPPRPAALLGDGVVDGGRAEQEGAAQADSEHQRRAGRREAPCDGAQVRRCQEAADRGEPRKRRAEHPRGETRHDRAEEAHRRDEEERRHLPCRRGRVRGARGRGDGEQRRRTGERHEPADQPPRPDQPWLDRRFGQRMGRRHARGTPAGPKDREERRQDATGDRRRHTANGPR
jgi:transcription termination factor Rho